MYTGTMIEDLMATVERAETQAESRTQEERLAYWYAVSQNELAQLDPNLAGVA